MRQVLFKQILKQLQADVFEVTRVSTSCSTDITARQARSCTNIVDAGRNGGCHIPGAIVVAIGTSIVDSTIVIDVSDGNVARPGRIPKGVTHDCEVLHNCSACIDTLEQFHAMHNMVLMCI